MAKVQSQWTDSALQLWAQSESNAAGIQFLKNVLSLLDFGQNTPQALLETEGYQESIHSLRNSIAISNVFNREQARRSLYALNPDVYVELHFPKENKKYVDRMSYSVCQNKMVEWSKNTVSVAWWPVNFPTHDQAKAYAFRHLETLLQSVATRKKQVVL